MLARFFASALVAPARIVLVHAGVSYEIILRRTAAARKFTLRVRSAKCDIVLTMPARSSVSAAREFAQRNAGWVEARVRQLPQRVQFVPGASIPLRGVEHVIVHRPHFRKPVWIEAGMALHLSLCVAGEAAHVPRRVQDFLRREAKRDLEAAVRYHCSKIGKAARTITLRDTTSRWGSCSSRGSLNFSWRLILAPGFVLDYLAAHEVAHLQHMDHSPRFWAVTRSLVPDFERAEAWLKSNGASLHRFGGSS